MSVKLGSLTNFESDSAQTPASSNAHADISTAINSYSHLHTQTSHYHRHQCTHMPINTPTLTTHSHHSPHTTHLSVNSHSPNQSETHTHPDAHTQKSDVQKILCKMRNTQHLSALETDYVICASKLMGLSLMSISHFPDQ